jgi:transposase
MREVLVESRTKLINCVRGWLRTETLRLRGGAVETFPKRVRDLVETQPAYVERLLVVTGELNEQIHDADIELAKMAESHPVCRRLMTVPGVGPVTAVRFLAAVDEVGRFPDPHKLESYLGLVPGENSSSDRRRRTSITKAGPAKLRWTLIQACWSARRCAKADPMVLWAEEIEHRRGKRIAIVALARKMVGILFALWKNQTTYDPGRSAQRKEPQKLKMIRQLRAPRACVPADSP